MPSRPLYLTALMCALLLFYGCGEAQSDRLIPDPEAAGPDPVNPHTKAPEHAILDAAGVAALRQRYAGEGKVLVVDCWATWCGSCVAMFPRLHEVVAEQGDKAVLVTLSFDEGEDYIRKAGAFLAGHDATGNAYLAAAGEEAKAAIAGALSEQWAGGTLPAVFVFGPDGSRVYEMLQTEGDVQDWVAGIMAAVEKAAAP